MEFWKKEHSFRYRDYIIEIAKKRKAHTWTLREIYDEMKFSMDFENEEEAEIELKKQMGDVLKEFPEQALKLRGYLDAKRGIVAIK